MSNQRHDRVMQNLFVVFASICVVWLIACLVVALIAMLPEDPPKQQPSPQKVIMPDGRMGVVTDVIVKPDGTRWFRVEESEP